MFALSKILAPLADPLALILLALALGWALSGFRRTRRFGRALGLWTLLAVALVSVYPFERWALAGLENRFPPPRPLPDHVDGVIVLGGGLDPVMSQARGTPALNSAAARMTALIPLARRYPEARLIFTGGSGSLMEQRFKEADYVKEFYEEIGFNASRVMFESQSRNTAENATLSKQMAEPKAGEVWLLITSAWHMPRAVGAFRAAGWPVLAYPVDYRTTGAGLEPRWADIRFNPGAALSGWQGVFHEAAGLIAYRAAGWTAELYPAP